MVDRKACKKRVLILGICEAYFFARPVVGGPVEDEEKKKKVRKGKG